MGHYREFVANLIEMQNYEFLRVILQHRILWVI